MKLSDLLKFNDIVLQCHDNPDADALASGYGLYNFFASKGKKVRFIYRGPNRIQKKNLLIMIDELKVPISYEPDFDKENNEPELLLTVDCQHGQRNVTTGKALNLAVIDHHQVGGTLPKLSEVRSGIGSASTIVWDMLTDEGFDIKSDILLSTALYYGLYTDTNKLSEVSHPLDRDMLDELVINKSLIKYMNNSNISLDELRITGDAISSYDYHEDNKYLIIKAGECDPNILGVMSDFALETYGVDVCLAYYESETQIKFSVRSCTKEVHANELAAFLSEGVGGGGGHIYKAGGTIRPEMLSGKEVDNLFKERLSEYYDSYDIIYAKDTAFDITTALRYVKKPQERGCVKLSDVFPLGTKVLIRTMEGDVELIIDAETYVMIGAEGEIYPITAQKLEKSYDFSNKIFDQTFEYTPSIKNLITGEKKTILKYAKTIVSEDNAAIYARPLTKSVKLFTAWDDERYYLGNIGDYIACRADDQNDTYIINKKLFDRLYQSS